MASQKADETREAAERRAALLREGVARSEAETALLCLAAAKLETEQAASGGALRELLCQLAVVRQDLTSAEALLQAQDKKSAETLLQQQRLQSTRLRMLSEQSSGIQGTLRVVADADSARSQAYEAALAARARDVIANAHDEAAAAAAAEAAAEADEGGRAAAAAVTSYAAQLRAELRRLCAATEASSLALSRCDAQLEQIYERRRREGTALDVGPLELAAQKADAQSAEEMTKAGKFQCEARALYDEERGCVAAAMASEEAAASALRERDVLDGWLGRLTAEAAAEKRRVALAETEATWELAAARMVAARGEAAAAAAQAAALAAEELELESRICSMVSLQAQLDPDAAGATDKAPLLQRQRAEAEGRREVAAKSVERETQRRRALLEIAAQMSAAAAADAALSAGAFDLSKAAARAEADARHAAAAAEQDTARMGAELGALAREMTSLEQAADVMKAARDTAAAHAHATDAAAAACEAGNQDADCRLAILIAETRALDAGSKGGAGGAAADEDAEQAGRLAAAKASLLASAAQLPARSAQARIIRMALQG